jgi:hypothetical protein
MDSNIIITTPIKTTDEILAFCSEIDSTYKPIFVPVKPVDGVRFNYCLTDVPAYSEKNGGSVQFGWMIWECSNVFLEAEFHACWFSPEGDLIDITPKTGNENKILFLPDSQRKYEHKAVANKRKALVDNKVTRFWLECENKKDELRAKYFKNDEIDDIAANAEFDNWLAIRTKKRQKIGRNDPCPCGSGKKYKRCCL